MTKNEVLTLIVSIISALISLVSAWFAKMSLSKGEKMFKRQGVIDLHMAWQGINDININDIIGPDVIKAVNALTLTSALWNHDVIEKAILIQSYWPNFQTLYDKLYSSENIIPGYHRTCKSTITPEITRAYIDMKNNALNMISSQSKI